MMDAGRPAEAAAFAQRSVDADAVALHEPLPDRRRRAARQDAATRRSRRSGARSTRNAPNRRAVVRNLHAGLADCLARTGRAADAEREFQAELADIPWSPEGRVGLATLYRSQGRDAEARTVLAGLVTRLRSRPRTPTGRSSARSRCSATQPPRASGRRKARERFPRDSTALGFGDGAVGSVRSRCRVGTELPICRSYRRLSQRANARLSSSRLSTPPPAGGRPRRAPGRARRRIRRRGSATPIGRRGPSANARFRYSRPAAR